VRPRLIGAWGFLPAPWIGTAGMGAPMRSKWECVVIGAGPAGLTTALLLARSGVEVLVLERGEYPGSKNMFGGALYTEGLNQLIPDFWEEAPLERPITRWVVTLLGEDSAASFQFQSCRFRQSPYNAFTVLRSNFDRWYAAKAEEAGATVLCEALVEDLLWEGGRVAGVRVGRDRGEIPADVVVAADGVNSLVARKSGLRKDLSPSEVSLGVKEVLELPRGDIERKFSLSDGEGMAQTFVGMATKGIPGGGFIYTNRDGVSVGVVTKLSSLKASGLGSEELLEGFKRHPLIWPLIKEGVSREYSAHLIPEGTNAPDSRLYADGMLVTGDAAGFTLSMGVRLEGANCAIASGVAAAEAILEARGKKDFSRRALAAYPRILRRQGLLSDMRRFRNAPDFFKNPRLYCDYPEIACRFAESIFTVQPGPKSGFFKLFKEGMRGRVSWSRIFRDALAFWRALA